MEKTEKIFTNLEIVTIAVSVLGGATQPVDIEDVAVLAYQYVPDKFSWRKYPDRIDLRVVQYALKDATNKRKGEPLLKGSIKHGFMLTPLGLEWIENNQLENVDLDQNTARRQSIVDKLSLEQARLITSTAYIKFDSNNAEDIRYSDFQEFARINDYFPKHIRQNRYIVIDNAVRGNAKLEELWRLLTKKFIEGDANEYK